MRPATRELLDRAKGLIQEAGWHQGDFTGFDDEGNFCGYCIMGALRAATNELDSMEYCAAYHHIMDKIGAHNRRDIYQYNDDPARTKEQVLALFD